jgi:hypothetical protein
LGWWQKPCSKPPTSNNQSDVINIANHEDLTKKTSDSAMSTSIKGIQPAWTCYLHNEGVNPCISCQVVKSRSQSDFVQRNYRPLCGFIMFYLQRMARNRTRLRYFPDHVNTFTCCPRHLPLENRVPLNLLLHHSPPQRQWHGGINVNHDHYPC